MDQRHGSPSPAIPGSYLLPILMTPLLVEGGARQAQVALILAAAGVVPVALAARIPEMAAVSGFPWPLRPYVALMRGGASIVYVLFLAFLAGAAADLGGPARAATLTTLVGAGAAYVLPGPDEGPRGRVAGMARRLAHVLTLAAVPAWVLGGPVAALLAWLGATTAVLTGCTARRMAPPGRAQTTPPRVTTIPSPHDRRSM